VPSRRRRKATGCERLEEIERGEERRGEEEIERGEAGAEPAEAISAEGVRETNRTTSAAASVEREGGEMN
jgi:hypothetical protein